MTEQREFNWFLILTGMKKKVAERTGLEPASPYGR